MHASVRDVWLAFNERFEGRLPFMYLDVRGLVTTGVGNLADPVDLALRMPWDFPALHRAWEDKVRAEWALVKSRRDLINSPSAFKRITDLRLTREGIDAIVSEKLNANEEHFARECWIGWATFPADAQLGIHSMAWAMGSRFYRKFPKFTQAAGRHDWVTAAAECTISERGNLGVRGRNEANRALFLRAAQTQSELGKVHWP
jgi:GH24 family phage-related lysozyme (muramidase)